MFLKLFLAAHHKEIPSCDWGRLYVVYEPDDCAEISPPHVWLHFFELSFENLQLAARIMLF